MPLTTNDIGKMFKCRLVPYAYVQTNAGGSNPLNVQMYLGQLYESDGVTLGEKCFAVGAHSSVGRSRVNNLRNKVQFDGYCALQFLSFTFGDHPLDAGPLPLLSLLFLDDVGIELEDHRYKVITLNPGGSGSAILVESKNASNLPLWGNPKSRRILGNPNVSTTLVDDEYYALPYAEILDDSLVSNDIADINTFLAANFIDRSFIIRIIVSYKITVNSSSVIQEERRTVGINYVSPSVLSLAYQTRTVSLSTPGVLGTLPCNNTLRDYSAGDNILIRSTDNVNPDDPISATASVLNSSINMVFTLTRGPAGNLTNVSYTVNTPPAGTTYSDISVVYSVGRWIGG
jgi:hypothetical protein